ncbi:hypothetical protein [Streptomyces sp. KL116D]|uniref:KS-MAT linker domain-containing protein n=1 Tax=Streptomyces sp. KL116D TaxID=3045152 RepID=UPI003557AB70
MTGGLVPWVLSGKNAAALERQAAKLRDFVTARPGTDAGDTADTADIAAIGATLVSDRTRFEHRAVVLGPDRDALTNGLAALAGGTESTAVVGGSAGNPGRVAFMFPGQGSQWAGMGRATVRRLPGVRAVPRRVRGRPRRVGRLVPPSTCCAAPRGHRPSTGWTSCSPRCSP